jgi:hypothetical protein
MKHLKKFEELNITTYIKAGDALKKHGHLKRGQKMIDWAKRGELDKTPDLNLWIKWMNSYTSTKTKEKVTKGIISDVPIKAKVSMIHVNIDNLGDDFEYHKTENSYPIFLTISFSIGESELEKIKPEYLEYFKEEAHDHTGIGGYKIFPMELTSGFSLNESGNIDKVFQVGFFTYNEMGTMFSDRKSANNFRTILRSVLSNQIKVYTGYKDEDTGDYMTNSEALFDRLEKKIPTLEISDIEQVIDGLKNVNINVLYNDDIKEAEMKIQH